MKVVRYWNWFRAAINRPPELTFSKRNSCNCAEDLIKEQDQRGLSVRAPTVTDLLTYAGHILFFGFHLTIGFRENKLGMWRPKAASRLKKETSRANS